MTAARAARPIRPFHSVLVPTDFTEGSNAAIDRALQLPLAHGACIEILHVLPESIPAKARAKVEARAREALAEAVTRACSTMRGDLVVTSELVRGEGYVGIIRHARRIGAELIVIGRHGRRPVRDLFLGATAARVVRMGDAPVLVVKAGVATPYRRPVVATDLGDTSRHTLELGLRIVGNRATVRVVHAFHVPFESFLAPTRAALGEVRRPYREKALAQLAALVAPYEDQARWSKIVRAGDARALVLNEAVRGHADVIAIGTHGRSGLSRALIGSVAEDVIANAPCDVLVARPVRFSFAPP
jgi:nucleotide-binding universal stress UspA family protein